MGLQYTTFFVFVTPNPEPLQNRLWGYNFEFKKSHLKAFSPLSNVIFHQNTFSLMSDTELVEFVKSN